MVRGTQGGGRVLARTSPQPGTQAVWGEVALGLRKDVTIALQCWRRAPGAGTDSLVGAAAVRVGDLVREGHVVALQLDGAPAPATLRVHSAEVAQQELAASSIVCMLRDRLFHSEGSEVRPSGGDHGTAPSGEAASQRDVARFYILRVHRLDQRLGVAFTTVDNRDATAHVGEHYKPTRGVAYFEPGVSLASFEVVCVCVSLYVYISMCVCVCV